jgi:hypothetical protein
VSGFHCKRKETLEKCERRLFLRRRWRYLRGSRKEDAQGLDFCFQDRKGHRSSLHYKMGTQRPKEPNLVSRSLPVD